MGLVMVMLRSSWQLDAEEELTYGNDMATIHGEFTVDQGLGGEDDTIMGGHAPYDPDKDGNNPIEETEHEEDAEYSDPQEEESYNEHAYSVGIMDDGGPEAYNAESSVDTNDRPPRPQY
jgi:hypothetical protein